MSAYSRFSCFLTFTGRPAAPQASSTQTSGSIGAGQKSYFEALQVMFCQSVSLTSACQMPCHLCNCKSTLLAAKPLSELATARLCLATPMSSRGLRGSDGTCRRAAGQGCMRAIRHDVAVQGVLVVQIPGSCPLTCLRLGGILRNTKSAQHRSFVQRLL